MHQLHLQAMLSMKILLKKSTGGSSRSGWTVKSVKIQFLGGEYVYLFFLIYHTNFLASINKNILSFGWSHVTTYQSLLPLVLPNNLSQCQQALINLAEQEWTKQNLVPFKNFVPVTLMVRFRPILRLSKNPWVTFILMRMTIQSSIVL